MEWAMLKIGIWITRFAVDFMLDWTGWNLDWQIQENGPRWKQRPDEFDAWVNIIERLWKYLKNLIRLVPQTNSVVGETEMKTEADIEAVNYVCLHKD